ncbi:MAG: hypothetical protein MOIL_01401 [Candidatus Methanolliviera sp. GoM_oil]|nr:MAG: hypothetical protein MOIL_01401 [Candidatus Methanolliviera sp. GoM_oil]
MKVFSIRFRRINYDRSSMMLLVTRTTPKEEVKRKSEGLTLFLADLPDDSVRGEAMAKHSINYSHAMQVPGGYGYAKEQHVERWWREMQLCRLGSCNEPDVPCIHRRAHHGYAKVF